MDIHESLHQERETTSQARKFYDTALGLSRAAEVASLLGLSDAASDELVGRLRERLGAEDIRQGKVARALARIVDALDRNEMNHSSMEHIEVSEPIVIDDIGPEKTAAFTVLEDILADVPQPPTVELPLRPHPRKTVVTKPPRVRRMPAPAVIFQEPEQIAPQPTGLLSSLTVLPWMDDGLCTQTDPEMFFPDKGGSIREAKKVCDDCTVKEECLDHALESNEVYGIWGGMSPGERRRLRKNTGRTL